MNSRSLTFQFEPRTDPPESTALVRRRVCVVTGSRAEYGLLAPIMRRIKESHLLTLQVVAAGMHLSPEFGRTVDLIQADGFRVDVQVDMLLSSDSQPAMAKSVGIGVYGMAQAFEVLSPDVVVALGDRVEAFAAAIAASLSGRVLAHVHGGDRTTAGFDEYMRHAITKLAHLHFTATEASRVRVERLGERADYIWNVGAPGLDDLYSLAALSREELCRHLGFSLPESYLVVAYHPVSTVPDAAVAEARAIMEAIGYLGLTALIIGPNSDAGGRVLAQALQEVALESNHRLLTSLPRNVYLSLLKHACCLVGNTSSGIIEGSALRVPYVLVGSRQDWREKAPNVLPTPPETGKVVGAIRHAVADPSFRAQLKAMEHPYGDGHAAERIVRILETVPLSTALRQKVITY